MPGFSFAATRAVPGEMVLPDAPFAVAITLFSCNLMWSTTDLSEKITETNVRTMLRFPRT